MTARTLRSALRWLHLLLAGAIGTFVYSPWGTEPAFVAAMRWGVIPLLGLTGLWMWKQAWFRGLVRTKA